MLRYSLLIDWLIDWMDGSDRKNILFLMVVHSVMYQLPISLVKSLNGLVLLLHAGNKATLWV
jgi:hypothetical protein